jgi:hypothetical protein
LRRDKTVLDRIGRIDTLLNNRITVGQAGCFQEKGISMRSMTKRALLAVTLGASVMAAAPAQALSFNLIDTGGAGVGTQARGGFDIAAQYWSSVFTDNVTINFQIGFQTLAPNVLAQAGSSRNAVSVSSAYAALAADRSSTLDFQAVGSLQALGASVRTDTGAVTAYANQINATNNGYVDNVVRVDNDGSNNNSVLAMNRANAKALGITTDISGQAINFNSVDAGLTFSNTFTFDFDPSDGIASDAFDFIGVAIHEIGHALGFVSGVDSYDARTNAAGTVTTGLLENNAVGSVLDLFRYSDGSGNLDWSTSTTDKYFSLDSGRTQLFGDSRFSTGRANGDGQQASHWKDSARGVSQLGILDPTSGRGQMQEVTALDLSAYDAIGWNVNVDTLANPGYRVSTAQLYRELTGTVPEPATWATMLVGFAMVGAATRYRRRKTAVAFG